MGEEQVTWKTWCPIIGDLCINGHSKKMGRDPETKDQMHCAAWQRFAGENPKTGQKFEEWGCTEFRWKILSDIWRSRLENGTAEVMESLRNKVAETKDVMGRVGYNILLLASQSGSTEATRVLEAQRVEQLDGPKKDDNT